MKERPQVQRGNRSPLDAFDRCLDKGLVVKRWTCVRVLGIDLLTLHEQKQVASFTTYLGTAEDAGGEDAEGHTQPAQLSIPPQLHQVVETGDVEQLPAQS